MILFYDKKTGDIIATIDGRLHGEEQLNMSVSNDPKMEVGKFIIGWIEKESKKIACNLDKMELLQRFEDITPESPLDYKIDTQTLLLIKK
jgi:hypothetical protein